MVPLVATVSPLMQLQWHRGEWFFSFDELDSAGEMHPPIFSILHLPLIPFPTPSIFFVCVLAKLCIIAEEYVDYGAVVAISPSLHNSNSIILLAPYFVSFAFFLPVYLFKRVFLAHRMMCFGTFSLKHL